MPRLSRFVVHGILQWPDTGLVKSKVIGEVAVLSAFAGSGVKADFV